MAWNKWQLNFDHSRKGTLGKIFLASKASRRNLWSFIALAKLLVGAKKSFPLARNGFAVDRFVDKKLNKVLSSANRHLGWKNILHSFYCIFMVLQKSDKKITFRNKPKFLNKRQQNNPNFVKTLRFPSSESAKVRPIKVNENFGAT